MHKIKYFLLLSFAIVKLSVSAQIGYQVSLLNNATGEPRANERVTVTVRITDNNGNTVCEETKTETSNDFGVISMTVGDSEIFSNANWNNLPFFIEASVDGRLLGKSQLLSVPVAEHAKHTGTLNKDELCSLYWTWRNSDTGHPMETYEFSSNGFVKWKEFDSEGFLENEEVGLYETNGNMISIIMENVDLPDHMKLRFGIYSNRTQSIIIYNEDRLRLFQ